MSRILQGIHEFFYTLLAFPRAWRFMRNHRLWEGLRQYGWVARSLVIIGILLAGYMIFEAVDWFQSHNDSPFSAMMIGGDSLLLQWIQEASESMSSGMFNWITLILLEVVIYHFMRQTLKIILKKDVKNAHTFKPFLDAQIRMIKVSALAFIVESIFLGFFNMLIEGWIYWAISIFIRSMFLGYVIADNYNEQFDLTISQSQRNLTRSYLGICAGLGLPLLIMMQVPLFGTILGPLVTSVAAAIVLRERSDLHIIGYQMNEKEREQEEKDAARKAKKLARKSGKKARKKAISG
ncbi:MAG: hypothetical protein ACI81P_003010 [Neolewinella sp.]